MDEGEIIDLSSAESEGQPEIDRRAILEPVITRVVDALGGYEKGAYRMGDEVAGCLKDLKKLWRKDDTDDERTVARIFWETRVLINDLIPILLSTAGKGLVEDRRAISCVDLMTAMTWPIDMAEELKELDDEFDRGTDYTQLLQSHLHYKSALLKPGVMNALFGIMLPCLAKTVKERVERDGQVINVALHLIRNLAFIKDLPANSLLSADRAELSSLQSKLIRSLSETHILQLLLTIAANAEKDALLSSWNTLVLEIFYLLFRGVKPGSLIINQAKQPAENLHQLLAAEERSRKDIARKAMSRHSRFGTTISVKLNPSKKLRPVNNEDKGNEADSEPSSSKVFVLHRQQAINGETGNILDFNKRKKGKKGNTVDELARDDNLSMEARVVLQNLASEFVQNCFNPFLSALLKDIRSERAKITEKDNLRLLYVTKWFLEFFLSIRANSEGNGGQEQWTFGLIAEVTERSWIVWVLKRMREAIEEKPKMWTEFQAGIECLTQLLLLIDKMSSSEIADDDLAEAAEVLQQQLVYNGQVIDIALDSLRAYRQGTQSLAYLESSVHLGYALLRMLERWGKGKGEMYVRKKTIKKKKGKAFSAEDGIQDVEEIQEVEDVIHETMFTFEALEMKFAHPEITDTLLTYLARYKEFKSPENMRRVVSLMHRQAVKAKAEGLYFQVSTLDMFKSILADQKTFPRDQPYKDLVNLINFIVRQFFKALADDSFLAIEAFFPKNRGHWKAYSSWEPEEKTKRGKKIVEDTRFPLDVQVKKGYSWSDQLGISIATLVEAGQLELVNWTKDILVTVIESRKKIINETDNNDEADTEPNTHEPNLILRDRPSADALAKLTDHLIPYLTDEHADAATKNPQLKLLFRLSKFFILDEDADELEWYVPAGIAPSDLQSTLNVINQFLQTPIDLDGKKASQLLSKKTRRRRRRSPSVASDDAALLSGDEPKRKRRKAKKQKEKEQYKSAQFIEDSDAEYGNIEAFLEKEKIMREKATKAADEAGNNRPVTMKATGTKKRRKRAIEKGSTKKRKGDGLSTQPEQVLENDDNSDVEVMSELDSPRSADKARPRPKPRPIAPKRAPSSRQSSADSSALDNRDNSPLSQSEAPSRVQRTKRLIISDDD